MISYRVLLLNIIIIFIGVPIIAFLYFMPFSFFVDIEYVHHQNICAGQPLQTILTLREVKWKEEYRGIVTEQLFKYEDGLVFETVIRRETPVIYQKNDNELSIEIEWDHNLPAGEYGVYTIAEINAGFLKKEIRTEEDQRFVVTECGTIK